MKLFYAKGACSLATRIVIHEMGIPCTFESVNLKVKQTESGQDFLSINPKGSVPVLQLDNKEYLTENAVIMEYLADTHKSHQLLPPIGQLERYRVLEWLNHMSSDLHKSIGALFNPALKAEYQDTIVIPTVHTRFNYIDQALKGKTWLCGDQFTLPDAYLFVILTWTYYFKIDLQQWPELCNFVKRASQRPAVIKAMQEEGIVLPD